MKGKITYNIADEESYHDGQIIFRVERSSHVVQQQGAQVATHPVAHQNSLDDNVLAVGGQRIGRYLPAPDGQAFLCGDVVCG